jgi:hypothetical protein
MASRTTLGPSGSVTRPLGSQPGAWVSTQSSINMTRSLLEQKWEEMKRKFGDGRVSLPSFWGGYRIVRVKSSSGRAGPTGCTAAFCTLAKPTASGRSTAWLRDCSRVLRPPSRDPNPRLRRSGRDFDSGGRIDAGTARPRPVRQQSRGRRRRPPPSFQARL